MLFWLLFDDFVALFFSGAEKNVLHGTAWPGITQHYLT